jgi:hypothetical protein
MLQSLAGLDPAALSGLHAYLVFAREPAPGTTEQGQVSGTAYLAPVKPRALEALPRSVSGALEVIPVLLRIASEC